MCVNNPWINMFSLYVICKNGNSFTHVCCTDLVKKKLTCFTLFIIIFILFPCVYSNSVEKDDIVKL